MRKIIKTEMKAGKRNGAAERETLSQVGIINDASMKEIGLRRNHISKAREKTSF